MPDDPPVVWQPWFALKMPNWTNIAAAVNNAIAFTTSTSGIETWLANLGMNFINRGVIDPLVMTVGSGLLGPALTGALATGFSDTLRIGIVKNIPA